MTKIKIWKEGTSGEPKFLDFTVDKKAVLQVTDIKTNRNKYYAVELHSAKNKYRVYTHYGRTDDLETNPNAGVRESRYFDSLPEAEKCYNSIYKQKTGPRKGYKEVSLASSKIGSSKSIGKSSGHVDDETLKKINSKKKPQKKSIITLDSAIQDFVEFIYAEATNALINTVNVSITANGIETPLGVLTLGQINKGEEILNEIGQLIGKNQTKKVKDEIIDLSGQFYTVIPHRIGRSKTAASQSVIDSANNFDKKQETIQLMKDMLSVDGDGHVLANPEVENKYKALGCEIECINNTGKFKELKEYVEKSQVKRKNLKVQNIYKINRKSEDKAFRNDLGNKKLLFHGSRAKNWVGILSRGLLMPKTVVSLGVSRTDAGWLGNGLYFGNAACTTVIYTSQTRRGTRLMTIANVALGKIKQYKKITYGLSGPPKGYDSCHGVRRKAGVSSEFDDDEFVIYSLDQQKLEYIIEYKV